jgi:hypothetical protein
LQSAQIFPPKQIDTKQIKKNSKTKYQAGVIILIFSGM